MTAGAPGGPFKNHTKEIKIAGFPSRGLWLSPARAFGDPKLGELRSDRSPMAGWEDLLVDVEDFPIAADIKRPPRNARGRHAVCYSHLSGRVAQERVVHAQRLCIGLACLQGLGADGEQRGIERPDVFAALTERLAFGGSASAECLDKPDKNHRLLTSEVSQAVSPAVRSQERKRRRRVARFELGCCLR
jgi:hypothetical protein